MTHASLFSGIGGPEVAAAMLGWTNAFHCEINPFGRAVLEYWFPNSVSYENIITTDFTPWRGRVDVLTGGFPCQPFSYAGQRRGHEDDRYLWPQMLRAIDEIRPAWVCGENVAGIATMVEGGVLADLGCYATLFQESDAVHGYEFEQPFTIERICGDLEHLGYSVQPLLIPAAAVGAPHRRDRIFILAADADTHRRDDTRSPGTDAGTGREERLQERDEVRESGEPDQLRPALRRAAENAQCDGCGLGTDAVAWSERDKRDTRAGNDERLCGEAGIPAADPDLQRCDKPVAATQSSKPQRFDSEADNQCLRPGRCWERFPAQSPICGRNDGLPFDVDGLSISAGKWRTEALKAYGNAIVPQVMYRIFQAIEQTTKI